MTNDNVRHKVRIYWNKLMDKSKEAWELANLKGLDWMMQRKKKQILLQLGDRVYKNHVSHITDSTDVTNILNEIMELDSLIEENNNKISSIINSAKESQNDSLNPNEEYCSCGVPLRAGDSYCSSCGKEVVSKKKDLPHQQQNNHIKNGICPLCAVPYEKDDIFCHRCGAPLDL